MIIDIVLLVLCVLFVIAGIHKGFIRSVISLMGVLVTLLLAIFLAKPFGDFLSTFIPFDAWIGQPILDSFNGMGGVMIEGVPGDVDALQAALKGAGIPGFISGMIAPLLIKIMPNVLPGTTLAGVLAPFIADLCVTGIAGVVLFILFRIAFTILEHFAKKLANIRLVKVVDKSLGAVFGAVKCGLLVLCVFALMSLMMSLSFMAPVQKQIDESKVSKFLYEHNFIAEFIFGKVAGDEEAQPQSSESPTTPPESETPAESETMVPEESPLSAKGERTANLPQIAIGNRIYVWKN